VVSLSFRMRGNAAQSALLASASWMQIVYTTTYPLQAVTVCLLTAGDC